MLVWEKRKGEGSFKKVEINPEVSLKKTEINLEDSSNKSENIEIRPIKGKAHP